MSARVLLHVGTPKTGTSYLQDVLWRSRPALEAAGVLYPADRFDAHFLAALDLMDLPWGGLEAEAVGRWEQLAAQVRAFEGTSIISHEILATATRTQAARALADLGQGDGTDIHVLISVRDLARQIPAEWQETIKHRATLSYATFLTDLRSAERSTRVSSWFWAAQEIPAILERWGQDLPPENIHLVTVPPPGADRGLLWRRFAEAFELDGIDLDLAADRANASLGVPEAALVRRINLAATGVVPPPDYRELVRELLAHRTLSARSGSPRLSLPPDVHPWAVELWGTWEAEIADRGYDVVGDLADLHPGPAPTRWADPDSPRESQVSAAAVEALTALLVEGVRLRESEARLHRELAETRHELHRALDRPGRRFKERTLRYVRRSRVGRKVHAAYRRVLRRR
ncbi:hypothetical protein [Nocardioides sp. GY 10127]|uniref:hypothetical protein n=1 Tax=Nocardioides sp. GY 10127 TaxID=2569762 RepID=UPI0010A9485F|nr:hypothetical protein [Nocardioides sp. GY 10127]TIC82721.1 hypothetical protein E8D37_08495 [Nocardioides sp. GY 10127]